MKHFMFAFFLAFSGCKNPSKPVAAVIDCAKADQAKAAALLAQLAPLLQGNSPDWTAIEAQAVAAGVDVGGCVLAQLVQDYLVKKGAEPGATTVNARDALEDFRAKHAGGASFIINGKAL